MAVTASPDTKHIARMMLEAWHSCLLSVSRSTDRRQRVARYDIANASEPFRTPKSIGKINGDQNRHASAQDVVECHCAPP